MTPEQESILMKISMAQRGPSKAQAQARLRKSAADFAIAIARETDAPAGMHDVLVTLNNALDIVVNPNQEALL